MSLAAAIIRRELFGRVRRKRFYLKRMAFVLVCGCLVLVGFATSSGLGVATTGIQIFSKISFFMMIAACFAAPWSAAPALAQEKEDRTLGLLFLADMRPWEIVCGKLFPAGFSTFATILSGLPLLVLCVGLGGVSTAQVLNGVAILLAAVFLGTCVGLAVSSITRTERSALTLTIVTSLLMFVTVPTALRYWDYFTVRPTFVGAILPVVSPFDALGEIVAGNTAGVGVKHCMFDVGLGIPFLLLAFLVIPRLAVDRKRLSLFARMEMSRTSLWLNGNPVAWKERVGSMRPRTRWWVFGLSIAASILVALMAFQPPFSNLVGPYFDCTDLLVAVGATVAVVSAAIFAIGVISACSNSFTREKKSRAFELLLITGLSETEIILGKLWGSVKTLFPWFISAALAFVLLAIALQPADPDEYAVDLLIIPGYASQVFGCACLAMYFSLRFRRLIAVGLTTLICIPWILNSSAALIIPGGAVVTIIVNLILAYICLGKLFQRMRQVSSGEKAW
jgi:ABC-type transport system involved in multi-copper enzyme maturation permease subunit